MTLDRSCGWTDAVRDQSGWSWSEGAVSQVLECGEAFVLSQRPAVVYVTTDIDPQIVVVTAVLDGPGYSKLKLPPTNPYVRKANGSD